MSIIESSLNKIITFHAQYQMPFEYDYYRTKDDSDFDYLKKLSLIFKDKYGFITERERLAIIAEIYSNESLDINEKEFLYLNYFYKEETPEERNNMFWKLTEREKEVERGKELWVQLSSL
jgi:hypothetical protein